MKGTKLAAVGGSVADDFVGDQPRVVHELQGIKSLAIR